MPRYTLIKRTKTSGGRSAESWMGRMARNWMQLVLEMILESRMDGCGLRAANRRHSWK